METFLSKLQKFIIVEAYKNDKITNADVLIGWYGFKPVSSGRIKFDRKKIGLKKYMSATGAASKSLNRLLDKGLFTQLVGWGYVLTPKGREIAQRLISGPHKKEC